MWSVRYLKRMDFRIVPVILALMLISLMVISAQTMGDGQEGFLTPKAIKQLYRFVLGAILYVVFACLDYNKLREWTWILYGITLVALLGLFFTRGNVGVQRWYTLPIVHIAIQPSEFAKLVVVLALSWFLERTRNHASDIKTTLLACVIVGVPFLLILKQPDLGSAMVLCPITLVMFYFGGVHPLFLKVCLSVCAIGLVIVLSIFMGVVDHEAARPIATKFIRDYQYERLNPKTYHQTAATTAIGVGGWTGRGWKKSEFSGRGWLPAAETDSVFSAFGEEFGLIGTTVLLFLFYTLIYFGFAVTAVAKDHFGRLLSAGITVYLAMHVITNIAMMCGFLPITGVPLVLVTYGGSSVLVTLAAMGILQSIFSRRFMF